MYKQNNDLKSPEKQRALPVKANLEFSNLMGAIKGAVSGFFGFFSVACKGDIIQFHIF